MTNVRFNWNRISAVVKTYKENDRYINLKSDNN